MLPQVAINTNGHASRIMHRVGQNHTYTVYVRYLWQGNHQLYVHIRCIYTVLVNLRHAFYQAKVFLAHPRNTVKGDFPAAHV